MTVVNKPVQVLNSLCEKMNLSSDYAEITRQQYQMSSFMGLEKNAVLSIFKIEIELTNWEKLIWVMAIALFVTKRV
jgi:hypothetical protein